MFINQLYINYVSYTDIVIGSVILFTTINKVAVSTGICNAISSLRRVPLQSGNDGHVCALCLPLPSLHLSGFYEILLLLVCALFLQIHAVYILYMSSAVGLQSYVYSLACNGMALWSMFIFTTIVIAGARCTPEDFSDLLCWFYTRH